MTMNKKHDPYDVPICRLVLRRRPLRQADKVRQLLVEAFRRKWPVGLTAQFTITPGGFITGQLPSPWPMATGWSTDCDALASLKLIANEFVDEAVSPEVLRLARSVTRYLTLGIDLNSTAQGPHAELVAVIDCRTGKRHWTGKSYPTASQEHQLIHVTDLNSHFVRLRKGGSALVLGCHDLNIFSHRAHSKLVADGARHVRSCAMRKLMRKYRPSLVLHHPHSTDSPNIWSTAWAGLAANYPYVNAAASAIAWFNPDEPRRGALQDVLARTRKGRVTDIVL